MRLRASVLRWALGLAAAGVLALYGVALAQNVPAEFVVTGKAAEQIQDFTHHQSGHRAAHCRCVREGRDRPRRAGQRHRCSIRKATRSTWSAWTARATSISSRPISRRAPRYWDAKPSKNRMNRAIQDPGQEFLDIQRGLFANSGGLPIVVNKQLIGAVGVGGSAPKPPVWSDEICAHKALEAVIGPSVAPLVQDLPPRQNPNPGKAPVARFAAATPPKSSLPAEWVVGGKGAANVFDGNQISLAAAQEDRPQLP